MASCSKDKPQKQDQRPAAPVTVGKTKTMDVPVRISAVGYVEPSLSVGVKAQTGGVLERVHFVEGQKVKEGDPLFTIDPRPYEAALRQAEAALARDTAQMENARKEAQRYKGLAEKGYVSQEQYEQLRTNAEALDAVVKADTALLENARLQLSYCFIKSPVGGRTGGLLVHEGNLVKANADTPLVVINRIRPVNVTFTVPDRFLPEIRKRMAAGKVEVEAFASGEEKSPSRGVLSFVDNAADTQTGTIKLKASFDNDDAKLWPGLFMDVVVTLSVKKNATVAPLAALQTGQQGQYVFIVKEDKTVEARPVKSDLTYGDFAVIEGGLAPGDTIVTDGQIRLAPGANVEIKGEETPAGGKKP